MTEKQDFYYESYEKHATHFKLYAKDGERVAKAKNWLRSDTVGAYLAHKRHCIVDPVLETYQGASWLTVGDGRYGSNAHYLASKGGEATATDISEYLLKEGAEMGYISKYSQENAEALSFEDESFDFVMCIEAFHHFPRPMKALYEMLRVARKGVVLLEPPDQYIYTNAFQMLFRNFLLFLNKLGVFKALIGKEVKKHTYEDVGNYVYKVSEREIEKVALGLNYPALAFKKMNQYYTEGIDAEIADKHSKLFKKIKRYTAVLDILTKLKLIEPSLLSIMIFKEFPSAQCIKQLKREGYKFVQLPRNPYSAKK